VDWLLGWEIQAGRRRAGMYGCWACRAFSLSPVPSWLTTGCPRLKSPRMQQDEVDQSKTHLRDTVP